MNPTNTNYARISCIGLDGNTDGSLFGKSLSLVNTAYREAGHAVAALCHGIPVEKVTAIPAGDYLGCCWYDSSYLRLEPIERMRLAVAGAIAEHMGTEADWSPPTGWIPSSAEGAGQDMQVANKELKKLWDYKCADEGYTFISWRQNSDAAGFDE